MLALTLFQQPARPARPARPAPPAPPSDTSRGRPCKVVIDSVGRQAQQVEVRPGETNVFAGGGVLAHCEGTGSTLAADSVAWFAGVGRFDMIGKKNRVHIRDTVMTLDATTAAYFLRQERLDAHNDVVAQNRSSGSVLRGPNLTYYRAAAGIRDTLEMFASSRPTIDYRAAGDSAEPYVIVADRVRFKGNDRMWGGGAVTIDRSDFAARGDSMQLDQAAGFGLLVGNPRVDGKGSQSYTLTGKRIELGLHGHEVKLVKALGDGVATGADWRLTADTIHLHIDRKKLQQAFAWGPKDSVHARAVSSRTTIRGDSLALDAPDQVLHEMRAFRHARSTSQRDSTVKHDSPPVTHDSRAVKPDSTAGKRDSAAVRCVSGDNTDWITGDSITARWKQLPDSAGQQRSHLRQLLARGTARALTHLQEKRDSTTGPSLNYSRGDVIDILLAGDRVDTVRVIGRADGVHLECRPPAPVADSTKKKVSGK